MIWPHSVNELYEFLAAFNDCHETIKFTMSKSYQSIPYLDVLVSIEDDHLKTRVYSKPTDMHAYLSFNSYHPFHIKKSIARSQFIRFKRICSSDDLFLEDSIRLFTNLLRRGYPYKLLKGCFDDVHRIRRENLLQYKVRRTENKISLVTDYDPKLTLS